MQNNAVLLSSTSMLGSNSTSARVIFYIIYGYICTYQFSHQDFSNQSLIAASSESEPWVSGHTDRLHRSIYLVPQLQCEKVLLEDCRRKDELRSLSQHLSPKE